MTVLRITANNYFKVHIYVIFTKVIKSLTSFLSLEFVNTVTISTNCCIFQMCRFRNRCPKTTLTEGVYWEMMLPKMVLWHYCTLKNIRYNLFSFSIPCMVLSFCDEWANRKNTESHLISHSLFSQPPEVCISKARILWSLRQVIVKSPWLSDTHIPINHSTDLPSYTMWLIEVK